MAQVNPYLTFNGNCEEAFNFYKSVFEKEFLQITRFKDFPKIEGHELPESLNEKIMHLVLPISKETVLMGSDANPKYGTVITGQNISLSVITESKAEADKIFSRLSAGGNITMPISDTFWNAYFGILTDKFQNIWMVSFENQPQ